MGNSNTTRLEAVKQGENMMAASRRLSRPVSDVEFFRGKKTTVQQEREARAPSVVGLRRTGSVRGYEPRSASLRRKRSMQRRSHLFGNRSRRKMMDLEADRKMAEDQSQLIAAAVRGDVDAVEALVDTGIDVNSTDENQMSVLHHAAANARDGVMKSLIERGANVNATDVKGGFSPMHWVVISANPQLGSTDHVDRSLVVLDKAGAKVNCTDFNLATPLHIAAQKGDRGCIKTLMRLGADPDLKDITGRDCFDVAKNSNVRAVIEEQKRTKDTAIYHVLEFTPSRTPPPSYSPPPPPPPTLSLSPLPPPSYSPPPPPAISLPPLPPPRHHQCSTRQTCPEKDAPEPFYHIPEQLFRSSTSISSPPTTPPPPPPRRRKQTHPSYPLDSHIYHVLEIPPPATRRNSQKTSAPRRRKASVRRL